MNSHLRLLGMALLWGASWPAGRILALNMSPLAASGLRFVLAASLLLPWLYWSGGFPAIKKWPLKTWLGMLAAGATGVFGYAAFFLSGLQHLPAGKAALVITLNPVATLLLAPFGGYALNLSAITAAICMGDEAHEDRSKRYTAAAVCGLLYILIGIFGAIVTGLLTAFPKELVACIAGLALLGSIGGGMATAFKDERHREAALITFLVTLSGVVIGGVGSAFWGVVAGSLALFVQSFRARAV